MFHMTTLHFDIELVPFTYRFGIIKGRGMHIIIGTRHLLKINYIPIVPFFVTEIIQYLYFGSCIPAVAAYRSLSVTLNITPLFPPGDIFQSSLQLKITKLLFRDDIPAVACLSFA